MRKTLTMTALALGLLVAAACSTNGNSPANVVNESDAPDSATVNPEQESTEPAANEITVPFGKGANLPGTNVLVTASTLSRPKLSTWSAPQVKGKTKAFAFTLTIANRGAEPFDPNMLMIEALCGSEQPEQVFDSANGFNGQPSKKLNRNSTVRFKMAFACTEGKTNPIEVDVEPLDFVNDSEITFKGALK
jgi:hypothetical protein